MDEWLLSLDGMWSYIGLLFALLGGALGLPIPEDIPLIIGGILVHRGQADVRLTFAVCYFGAIAGDLVIYFFGRSVGPSITKKAWFRLRFGQNGLAQAKASLERRSIIMIFVARHLFYLRTLTFLTCGAVKMNFWRFLIADAVAALVSVPLMLGVGYLAAEHYEAIFETIRKLKGISVVILLALLAFGIWYYRKKVEEKRMARRKAASLAKTNDSSTER